MSSIPAVIPAAGRGTRLRPITRYVSKPMLPVGSRPVISYALNEALEAGCDPVVVVRSPDDTELLNYVEDRETDRIEVVEQAEPLGLAHAALRAYNHIGRAVPWALLLPDNVVLDGSGIGSLIDARTGDRLVLGTIRVPRKRADDFGNSGGYESEPVSEGLERITALQTKGDGSFREAVEGWPAKRTVARSILPPEFFERAKQRDPSPESGEIDDVPIYRAMIESSVVHGVSLDGTLYDMGTPERYLKLSKLIHERNQKEFRPTGSGETGD